MLQFHTLPLIDARAESEDAVHLTLGVPPALADTFRSEPGQHIVLRATIDGHEVRRTYSLVNAAGALPLEIGVRRHAQGAMSRYLAALEPGATLEVMPPNGSFTVAVDPAASHTYVAFAAGCGITPVLSLVRSVLAGEPNSRFVLVYGNRSSTRTMFLDTVLGLKDRYLTRLTVHLTLSEEQQEIDTHNGRIDAARVRALARYAFAADAVDGWFLCGPGTMMADVTAALGALGVPAARIHAEHFTVETAREPAAVTDPGGSAIDPTGRSGREREAFAPTAEGEQSEVRVTVTMDGRERAFAMTGDADTVLEAGIAAGIDLPYSCCAGVCSTCRVRVIEGAVEMADNYALEDWELEKGYVLACQSRPTTPTLALSYDER